MAKLVILRPRMMPVQQVGLLMMAMLLGLLVQLATGVKDVPQVSMDGLLGETIYLPCNISTHEPGDSVVLVLWYREDKGSPIYSADTRGRDVTSAKRWSDETVFGQRAYFLFDKQPGELAVQNVREQDSGVYRCRVDFIVAQTRNSIVNLTIIVPPERVVIRDQQGAERTTVAGPYAEGDVVRLRCDVFGGRPLPTVSWYRDGVPLVAETKFVSTGGKHLRSEIVLGPLTRQDLHSKLVCKANNHVRASPVEQSVQIDMNFAPLNIRLIGAHQPLSAGHRYDLLCQSAGSRPAASITWFLDGIRLDKSKETTSADGNQTTSTLSISLNRTDAGKYLSCKAYNTYVPADALEDGWQLDIQYVPDAQVRLGSSLDPDSIREGTDVYFDCIVTAHPGVYKVEWKHNNKTLPHNISQGVIISNQSLVLQGVSRTTAGNYSCVGFNAEGEGASPVFPLNVMYAPTCAPNQQRVYGVAKQENAEIRCVVDANPPDVEFKWTFNNSAESIDVQASHISRLVGTSSVVSYTPMTELDYGTLLCVATNRIGKQRQACVFHIIAAGRPDQVHNCSLANVSMTSLNVRCYEGFNGGLAQSFFLELRDTHTQEVRFNNTAPVPRFAVPNLHPSAVYQLSVYAFNSKGKSEPYVMSAATLRLPEKQMNSEKAERPRSSLPLTPTLSIAIGLGAAILIGSCAIVLAFKFPCGGGAARRRNKDSVHHNHQSTTVRTSSPGPSDKSVASKEYDGNESDEKNPDVIPDTIDSDDQMEYIRRRQHISTIDTSSPSRLLLTTTSAGTAAASQAAHHLHQQQQLQQHQQTFMGSTMTLGGGNHSNLGYCTLRNGGGHGQNQVQVTNVSMAHGPGAFTSSTCTLPRHPAGLSLGGPGPHHWPSYGGTIAGVRNLTAISVTSSQLNATIPPPPPSTIAMQHLGGAGTLPRPGGGSIFLDQQHQSQQQQQQQPQPRSRNNVACLAEEDVSADTPLMVKRESTV